MKKIFAVFMCLVLCFSFAGCNNYGKINEDKAVFQKVLHKQQNFFYKSLVTDEIIEDNLDNFSFNASDNALISFTPESYTYVDFDFDNVEEMVINSMELDYYLVLRYCDDKVYGYIVGVRSIIDLRTDGSFMTSSSAAVNSISNLSFSGTSFEIKHKANENDFDNEYLLNGKTSNKETVKKYFSDWDKNTTKVSWTQIKRQ